MALSNLEIGYVQQGIVRPLETTLNELVNIATMKHAIYLKNTEKTIDPENELATICLEKQKQLSARISNKDGSVFSNFYTKIILAMGNIVNLIDLRTASTAQWETNIETHLPSVFDDIAGITTAERNAYNAI